jgi:ubiquitin-conjugating enzyme E2 Z
MSYDNISKTTINRLVKDIKEVINSDISKDGIYYKHSDTKMLEGYALIIGPPETPYEFGNFLFKFQFPADYPFSPPTVKYLTNDGKTRFHPNLYKNEKVCLSVINTWKGEGWTSCQTIKSILLILQSILDNKPLCHEPGFNETHNELNKYNDILKYRTLEVAIGKILSKEIYPEICELFWNEIIKNFTDNYEKILKDVTKTTNIEVNTSVYQLYAKSNYDKLKHLFKKQFKELS